MPLLSPQRYKLSPLLKPQEVEPVATPVVPTGAPSGTASSTSVTPTAPPSFPPLVLGGTSTLKLLAAQDFNSGRLRGFGLWDASVGRQPAEAYYTDLATTGANLGRAWITLRRCSGCNEYTLDNVQVQNIDNFIAHARAKGFWIVVVVTTGDERAGELWSNDQLQQSLIAKWRLLSRLDTGTCPKLPATIF